MTFQALQGIRFNRRVTGRNRLGVGNIKKLYDHGIIGPGKKIDTYPLLMDASTKRWNSPKPLEWPYRRALASICWPRERSVLRNAGCWRLNDILRFPHGDIWITSPCLAWNGAYGNLMDSRDINNHDIQLGPTKKMPCEEYVKMVAPAEMPPYSDDPFMFDYSWQGEQAYKTGIYSDHRGQICCLSSTLCYFYKESVLCWRLGIRQLFQPRKPRTGEVPLLKQNLFSITRSPEKNLKFTDGIEIGRKAWNLMRAIFVMQDRHRDAEKFAGFMYKPGAAAASFLPPACPCTTVPGGNGAGPGYVSR